jgi:hypothetical protein
MLMITVCALGKFPMVQGTLFCRHCNHIICRWVVYANSQAGQTQVITDLIKALLRVNLMLAPNRPFE